MNKAKQRYDSKHKLTRILLADYLFVKQFSIGAGVSMAEALHQLIIGVKPKAKPVTEPVPELVTEPVTQPAFRVKVPVAFRVRSEPTITVNGTKHSAFVVKPKGGIINA